jgi:two-component system chemotaxis response regulator CheY
MRSTFASRVEEITRGLRVLVIADNPYLRKLVRSLLVNVGVKHIDEVADGLAGLEAVRIFEPDIAIFDWDLPLLSGAELVRILRTPGVHGKSGVALIAFSNKARRRQVSEAKKLGVDAFLVMPMSAKTLLDRLLTIVSRRPAAPAGNPAPIFVL